MGARPLLGSDKSIVFFDANCLLCSRFIRIILKNDRGTLFFSGFDTSLAADLLVSDLRIEPSTVVFSKKGILLFKSKAIFAILAELHFPWPILCVFSVLPSSLNDAVYDFIAKNRFSWFGKSDECFLPSPDQRDRFFD